MSSIHDIYNKTTVEPVSTGHENVSSEVEMAFLWISSITLYCRVVCSLKIGSTVLRVCVTYISVCQVIYHYHTFTQFVLSVLTSNCC